MENSTVDSRARAVPSRFTEVFRGLMMAMVPATSSARAAKCRGRMGSFSRKKARKVTKTGLQLKSTAATDDPA